MWNAIVHIALILFYAISIIIALYFLLPVILFILHWLLPKGRRLLQKKYPIINNHDFTFAAIVTAHQDTRFIAPLVDSFLQQTYPHFTVYIVADDCDISNLHFSDERIKILRPETPLHGKIYSIKYAVEHFEKEPDVMIIFDSDNLVHPQYLQVVNDYFKRGFRAVQTHMLSKNVDSLYAKLDSIGHIYNTFTERQVKMQLGLSSAILGLGIALEAKLYKEIFYKDSLGGFDKKLQAELMKRIPQIAFAEGAIVYDEKIETGAALEKQRTRWIYAYFKYLAENAGILWSGIKRFNFNQLLFGFTMLRPPLFITFAIAFVLLLISFFIHPAVAIIWIILLLAYAVTYIFIIVTQSRQPGMLRALVYIPKMIVRQLLAVLKIKKAGKEFLKTEHRQIIYIKDVLNNEVA